MSSSVAKRDVQVIPLAVRPIPFRAEQLDHSAPEGLWCQRLRTSLFAPHLVGREQFDRSHTPPRSCRTSTGEEPRNGRTRVSYGDSGGALPRFDSDQVDAATGCTAQQLSAHAVTLSVPDSVRNRANSDSKCQSQNSIGHCLNVPLTCANVPTVTIVTENLHISLHTRIMHARGSVNLRNRSLGHCGHSAGDVR